MSLRDAFIRVVVLIAIGILGASPPFAAVAQTTRDDYQVGPDPIAPQLPAVDVAPEPEQQGEAAGQETSDESAKDKDKKEKKDEKDKDLELLDAPLQQLSRTQVTSPSPAMSMEVSTVSRTESTVGKTPAAVYVLTNEMIRRSGARNIPEALRLVPGVQVARVNAYTWAISIRGFNGVFANKLLVQIDGRAVYSPGTAGVPWDIQQMLLEDVERIEIIRGPGASVWGANAVNGVINIVTKSSADTRGVYAYTGGGSEHRSFNALRVGGRTGELNWRLYGMQADDGCGYFNQPFLGTAWDAYQFAQGGFRMDWTPTSRDTLTLQGDFLGERETLRQLVFGFPFDEPDDVRATDFLGRWTRQIDEDTDWSVQTYYYGFKRTATGLLPRDLILDAYDLDMQFHTKIGDRHDVVCGFGYRNYESTVRRSDFITFVPPRDTFDIISYFVQDTIELRPDRLFLTAGIKLEHNDFTNFEWQPTIRVLMTPNDRTAIWGAISRAVRTPAVNERDIDYLFGFIQGNKNLKSEDLLAYEFGIRRQPTDKLYWDLAAFFNRYDNLVGVTPLFPVLPEVVSNVGTGDTYGFELVVTYAVNDDWRLRSGYSFLVEDIDYPVGTAVYLTIPGMNPRNQCFLHSAWDLGSDVTFDTIFRYVDYLLAGPVPSYLVMDVRLAWEPRDGLEVAVVGQNLLDNHHLEYGSFGDTTQVQSGVYGMVSWRY
jgi:iron complex outermembrane receptor protein